MSFTKLDYCQYLLSSQINYTITNMAEHLKSSWSHDTINRYLKGEKLTPRLLFEQVEPLLEPDPNAYLIFDDTVLDKSFGPKKIEVTRKQWSGNEKSVIGGIGVVSCVYVNPQTERFSGSSTTGSSIRRGTARPSSITCARCLAASSIEGCLSGRS